MGGVEEISSALASKSELLAHGFCERAHLGPRGLVRIERLDRVRRRDRGGIRDAGRHRVGDEASWRDRGTSRSVCEGRGSQRPARQRVGATTEPTTTSPQRRRGEAVNRSRVTSRRSGGDDFTDARRVQISRPKSSSFPPESMNRVFAHHSDHGKRAGHQQCNEVGPGHNEMIGAGSRMSVDNLTRMGHEGRPLAGVVNMSGRIPCGSAGAHC